MVSPLIKSFVVPGWGLADLGKRNEAIVILIAAILMLPMIGLSMLVWLFGLYRTARELDRRSIVNEKEEE